MTQRNLSVELRPRRLSEMIGQDSLVTDIRNALGKGNVPLAVQLTGSFGAGKTTLATILGLSFNCPHQKQWGEPCDECLENEEMFQILEINCALMSTKDEMVDFLKTVRSYPTWGKYRIIILDEMQRLSDAAQQALLKEFERKDSVNIYFICTTNPEKINQGLKDRSVGFAIPGLNEAGVRATVLNTMQYAEKQMGLAARDPEPLIKELDAAFIASSRVVVTATENYMKGLAPAKAIQIKNPGDSDVDFMALYNAVKWGKWDEAREQLKVAKPADGAAIKMKLSAFFRNDLLRSPFGVRSELLAEFIRILGDATAIEAGLELSIVCGVCHRICQTVNENKKKPVQRAAA